MTMIHDIQTCRICGDMILHAGTNGVQFGRRHWAHKTCYVESGKPFNKLHRWQIESLPFRVLQRHNRLAEVEALLAAPADAPKR